MSEDTPTAPETEQQSHSQSFGENEHLYVPILEAGEVTHMHLYAPDPEDNMVLGWKGQNMAGLADEFLRLRTEVATLRASEARMREALALASNRLHRCSVDYDTGTHEFIETGEWAAEARAALQGETK